MDIEKLYIPDLIIEVTRNCNMDCSHCLRGEKQNLDIDLSYIEILFNRISSIGTLTITGGEPSLKPNLIKWIVTIAKRYNVDIGNFYIATNGKKVSNDFLIQIINLFTYCSDNEISSIKVSYDYYHDIAEEGEKLKVFSFVRFEKEDIEDNPYFKERSFINEGNAKENGIGNRELTKTDIILDLDNEEIEEGLIYLNAKGNIISGCDFSYQNQDKEENIICKVQDFSFKALLDYVDKVQERI
jgi:organic radical activating enzyme